VAPEVGIASWRADTWTWRPGPARRVGLGFGSARIAADCAHEIGGRLHGTADLVPLDRVDRDPRPLWCFPCQRLHAGGRRVQNEIGAWSGAPRSVLTGAGRHRLGRPHGAAVGCRGDSTTLASTPVMNIGQGRAHPPISSDSLLEGDGFEPLVPREGIGPFETTLIDLRPFTSAGSNLPRPGVCLRFAPPKSLTLWVNFSLGAVTIGAENFAWLAEQATGTPWVPRNPRPIAGPAQVREILQLAA